MGKNRSWPGASCGVVLRAGAPWRGFPGFKSGSFWPFLHVIPHFSHISVLSTAEEKATKLLKWNRFWLNLLTTGLNMIDNKLIYHELWSICNVYELDVAFIDGYWMSVCYCFSWNLHYIRQNSDFGSLTFLLGFWEKCLRNVFCFIFVCFFGWLQSFCI